SRSFPKLSRNGPIRYTERPECSPDFGGLCFLRRIAAIDQYGRTGDEGSFVARQEQHDAGNFLGASEPANWMQGYQGLFLVRGHILEQRPVDIAGAECIYPNVLRSIINRTRLRQAFLASRCCRIRRDTRFSNMAMDGPVIHDPTGALRTHLV